MTETETKPDEVRRINVAVNDAEVAAIKLLMEREGVTLTEAVRRLVGYGDFVYREVKVNRKRLVVHSDIKLLGVTVGERHHEVELLR